MSPLRLFRAILREASCLPHPYLQSFAKGRAGDYFRRYRNSPEPLKHLSRARSNLRKLERINRGERKPFMQLLSQAYGRTGKLRHELLQPHLASSDPTLPSRERIIPSEPNSVPPTYTPTLASLLTSPQAIKTSKPLSHANLLTPRTLPARAVDPSSEEARLLGPFSLRRLVNIHRRQYQEQMSRVLPPLEVRVLPGRDALEEKQLHVPSTGLEQYDPVQALVKLATAGPSPTPSRRKQGHSDVTQAEPYSHKSILGKMKHHNRRWLRRRYRELLASIPSVTVKPRPGDLPSEYKVDWASPELALAHDVPRPLRIMTQEEKEWIKRAQTYGEQPHTGRVGKW